MGRKRSPIRQQLKDEKLASHLSGRLEKARKQMLIARSANHGPQRAGETLAWPFCTTLGLLWESGAKAARRLQVPVRPVPDSQ